MYASFSRHYVCCTHVFKSVCDSRVYIHRKIHLSVYCVCIYIYIVRTLHCGCCQGFGLLSSALFGSVAVLLKHNLTCYSTNTNSEVDWTCTGLWIDDLLLFALRWYSWCTFTGHEMSRSNQACELEKTNIGILLLVVVVVIIFVVVILLFLLDRFCFSSSSYSVRFRI